MIQHTAKDDICNEPLFSSPIHVDFDITNACNLACSHCHAASGKRLNDELNTEEIINIISQLQYSGVIDLTIAGGEPFLRPDIIDILSHAQSCNGLYTTVVTNGTLLKTDIIQELSVCCPDIGINISIDGSTPDKLDILRHRKNRDQKRKKILFSQIIKGAKYVSNADLPLGISFVMSDLNVDELESVYRLAIEKLGALSVTAIRFFPAGYGINHLNELELKYKRWEQIILQLTKNHEKFKKLTISVSAPWEIYLPLISNGYSPEEISDIWGYRSTLMDSMYSSNYQTADASGIGDLNISGNGLVYPSVLMSRNNRVLCGDLRKNTINEIWYNSSTLKKIRKIQISDIGYPCNTCEISKLCGGGSRSRALAITNDLKGLDFWCPIVSEVNNRRKFDNVLFTQK
ncbi:radical SAM protein [Xenorhabdus bovienii]|uniref:radical SAM protein n=1 Tax=Xenorhabdus bovienii TaxID=40576 RepID=UPI00237C5D25|nr:radical SAM protein [Xenorhabdus bovienii]MDE1482045.1 radical SAM protein [Xenorhabdus bovienii]MDE9441118.1 radical SAM protein [Xenorhabdus bovienii]MDE9546568.1 radical SAM protein [Xenorhabdus bovienii]